MSNALPELVAGRYRLLSPLGQGGMGRVWKARDEVLHRNVAIKELVPPPSLTDEERREMRERSLREARAIARLNHVNVVRIFDVLRTDGDPWIVMEYVASKSLQDTLAEQGPVSPARAVQIGLGVLGALKAAHKAGVMHRDVKPGNVLLGEDGRVVLTDFGLATVPGDPNVTRTGMVLGSPAYIAPERARDGTAGPEADLWSLGATLYAAVEGKSPYARTSAIATLAALATEPPPPPKNAGPLRPVLNGLLRKDPTDRITAEVAERLLRRAGGKRSQLIPLLSGVRRPGPHRREGQAPAVVPAPRPVSKLPESSASAPPAPPSSPHAAQPAVEPSADAAPTAKVTGAGPTAPVDPPAARVDADPTAKLGGPAAAPASSVPPPGGAAAGTKRYATRRNLLIGAVVALLLLGLVVAYPQLTMEDDGVDPGTVATDAGSTAAPASSTPSVTASVSTPPTSASPTPSGTAGAALPAGWRLHQDPTGFVVPVPPGLDLDYRRQWGRGPEDYRVRFSDGQGRALLIDQTTTPLDDAAADWRRQEAARRGNYSGYQHVKIASVDYWDEAADWEWIFNDDYGRRLHVRNRGFVTAPDKGYAIRWDCPEDDWAANESTFEIIAAGFVPVRS
ncbi:serine/threonine-protein kinase [Salinispora tropica]|uniref:non-specific serine/threonine protein kinase n=1 Tax=Salinispora tropica (strain ATCC BAA-916 / DSM 44818 / JCM 13857 / NBRC 105044 / CNB-440) TaxID=369723 RepID=A4X379_SALTO|nr:serine/threonine-protein kinase [Salinispora tropica]ABP53329.1 serine/threonine protein kinase [Salinispora tropica CNB-440]